VSNLTRFSPTRSADLGRHGVWCRRACENFSRYCRYKKGNQPGADLRGPCDRQAKLVDRARASAHFLCRRNRRRIRRFCQTGPPDLPRRRPELSPCRIVWPVPAQILKSPGACCPSGSNEPGSSSNPCLLALLVEPEMPKRSKAPAAAASRIGVARAANGASLRRGRALSFDRMSMNLSTRWPSRKPYLRGACFSRLVRSPVGPMNTPHDCTIPSTSSPLCSSRPE